jgi:hypothetical protein
MALKLSDLTAASPPGASPPPAIKPFVPPTKESIALTAAKQSATGKVNSFLQRHKIKPFTTWAEVTEVSRIPIPHNFAVLPVTYITLKDFAKFYVEETEARINRAIEANKLAQDSTKQQVIQARGAMQSLSQSGDELDDKGLLPFNLPEPTFFRVPRQRKAYTQIVRELGLSSPGTGFQNPSSNAALVPLPAGQGKTAIAAMLIKRYQDNNYYGQSLYPINNIIYITPKRAREKTRRFLIAAGIKEVGIKIVVVSYSELRSQKWRGSFSPVKGVNPIDGTEFETYKYTFAPFYPALVIIDECHKIKKPDTKTSKYVNALLDGHSTRVLFMSATAAVVVNDLYNFAISSRKKWDSTPISKQNWKELAWAIAKADPKKPNGEAMKRFGEFFGDAIVMPPADPCKVKCYNSVKLIRFENEKDRQFYNNAEAKYFEACEVCCESNSSNE